MNLDQFTSRRAVLLRDGKHEQARELECSYLTQNPHDVKALWMAAWNSRALKRPAESAMFESLSRQAFSDGQRRSRESIAVKNKVLLNQIAEMAGLVRRNSTSDKSGDLLSDQGIDSVWGWAQYIPERYAAGEIADIGEFGRYKITDPSLVLEKRLCRGMPWEPSIVTFMIDLAASLDPRSLVFDIGANIGATCIPMALNCAQRVIGLEPLHRNFTQLGANITLNDTLQLSVLQKACGARSGTIHISDDNPTNPGMAHVSEASAVAEEVELVTLDGLASAATVGLIKIDVEGYEHAVLEGARETIARDRPLIVVELLGGATGGPAQALLTDAGYEMRQIGSSDYVFFPSVAKGTPAPRAA